MSSPIWASDMLRTAEKLAGKDAGPGRPALCDLRRATSTAHYALFHQILRHGVVAAVPTATEADGPCQGVPPQLLQLAEAFIQLQDARHLADYSNDYDPVRYVTIDHVDTAELAVRATWSMWRAGQSSKQSRLDVHDSYRRFLHLALLKSGGPRAR